MKESFSLVLGSIFDELKRIKHEHSIDENLDAKIDSIADRIVHEINEAKKDIIFNWRIVQILMVAAVVVPYL